MKLEPTDSAAAETLGTAACAHRLLSCRRLAVVFIIVSLAAAVVSGFLGILAGAGYAFSVRDIEGPPKHPWIGPTGLGGGILLGVFAGIWWVRRMVRRACEGQLFTPSRTGAFLGLVAGLAATLVQHMMLSLASGKVDLGLTLVGVGCGAVAGPVLGAIVSGLIPWACVKRQTATESEQ